MAFVPLLQINEYHGGDAFQIDRSRVRVKAQGAAELYADTLAFEELGSLLP